MTWECVRCGASIADSDVRYIERDADAVETYCSVNCIADVDDVDEERAQDCLFSDPLEA